MILFSVIIPTFNGEKTIGVLLKKLRQIFYSSSYKYEVIIIDSESKDKTLEVVKKFNRILNLRIFTIKKNEFNHGLTRNLGVSLSKGEYILFFSQDAVPVNNNFLDYLISDFKEDDKIVAVFGKEIAPPNVKKNFLFLEHYFWFKRYEEYFDKKGRVTFSAENSYLFNEEKMLLYSLSNVFCCYKASFLKRESFREIYIGEDILMGQQIIEKGYKKIYDSRCKVYHFHTKFTDYFIRSINDLYFRLYVIKEPLKLKLKNKLRIITKENSLNTNFFELIIFYLIKALIFVIVLLTRLKHHVLVFLNKKYKMYLIKKYI
ncbi:MAG: hypothetical protein KatS3mg091_663 [Patescibacteria group bacterium]|nr:MAG: hypothetical protein KatS3mg090_0010 [Patescibacteria group bacterium]GIW63861.1 MAG: hypothetical protein KatS3mg091_663 [Patescibacteria group bacterium]GIW65018.1 MAG: hypothetical protein KatS3mg092_0951 [Patescibacteria group bacterium]